MSWAEVLEHWNQIEADFASEYQVLNLPKLLRKSTARWFRVMLGGLINQDTRLRRILVENKQQRKAGGHG